LETNDIDSEGIAVNTAPRGDTQQSLTEDFQGSKQTGSVAVN